MTIARTNHIAVLLPNGKVLVAGGETTNGGAPKTATAELYDPASNTWTPTGNMNVERSLFTAVLLGNGKVLVAGGATNSGMTATAELYDPATGTWTLTGSMQHPRYLPQGQHAILLPSEQVLVVGGDNSGTSEIYDPTTGQWGALTNLAGPRCGGATALLKDGRVLIVGGTDCSNPDNKLLTAELYSPVA